MATEKRALLAHPHAFIVNEMRPFLIDAGFTPVRLESLDQLAAELSRPLQGAIISTAVTWRPARREKLPCALCAPTWADEHP